MSLDGISQVHARIASIQQRFQAPASRGDASAGNASFAEALASAELLAGGGGAGAGGAFGELSEKLRATGGLSLDDLLGSGLGSGLGSTAVTGGRTAGFLAAALEQAGDPYVWGAAADPGDADPDAFDCSELVRWAAARVGVDLPDGSWLQYLELKQQGATVSVEEALRTPGALLFSFDSEPRPGGGRPSGAHVAISLGDGRTIEARGRRYGVGTWEAGERFQYAAIVPELSGSTAAGVASPGAPASLGRPLPLWMGA